MEYNEIGMIAQTHGVKGELKIKTDSSHIEERFKVGAKVYYKVNEEYKTLTVKSHRSMLGYELLMFEEILNMDDATKYLKKILYGERDRSLLDEGEYYYADYIGLSIKQFGEIRGVVKRIDSFPHDDYLIVSTNDDKERMIPLRKEFICDVDLENKILSIVDMEGLLYD